MIHGKWLRTLEDTVKFYATASLSELQTDMGAMARYSISLHGSSDARAFLQKHREQQGIQGSACCKTVIPVERRLPIVSAVSVITETQEPSKGEVRLVKKESYQDNLGAEADHPYDSLKKRFREPLQEQVHQVPSSIAVNDCEEPTIPVQQTQPWK